MTDQRTFTFTERALTLMLSDAFDEYEEEIGDDGAPVYAKRQAIINIMRKLEDEQELYESGQLPEHLMLAHIGKATDHPACQRNLGPDNGCSLTDDELEQAIHDGIEIARHAKAVDDAVQECRTHIERTGATSRAQKIGSIKLGALGEAMIYIKVIRFSAVKLAISPNSGGLLAEL